MKIMFNTLSPVLMCIDIEGVLEVIRQGIEIEDLNVWMESNHVFEPKYIGSLLIYDGTSLLRRSEADFFTYRLHDSCPEFLYDKPIDLDKLIPVIENGLDVERMYHAADGSVEASKRIEDTEKLLDSLKAAN